MNFRQVNQFIRHLITSSIKHNIGSLAAIIAFFGFSATIPLILLIIYVTSVFLPHTTILNFISDALNSFVPTIPDTKFYLMQHVSRLSVLGSKVGGFGIIGLLWTSVSGFVSLQQILDIIWGIHQRRSFVKQYLVGLSMLGILLFLTTISSLVTMLTSILIPHVFTKSNLISWLAPLHEISFVLFPLLLFLTCYFCYRFLPSYTLNNAYLLIGALFSTLVIYFSQEVFSWYAAHLLQFELIYGSLTFIMLFTFWFYIACIIVLFGAEVAVALQAVIGPQKVKD